MISRIVQCLALVCSIITSTVLADPTHADLQIKWIKENGGFFSPKIAFQLVDENDPDSPYGVFALQDLKKGETLIVVPKECLVTSGGSQETCDTARNLVKQRNLGNESFFAPYVNYVFDPKHANELPSSWSLAGKALIKTIVGTELPPFQVTGVDFKRECRGDIYGDDAALQQEAYLIVLRRSWDDIMIPVFDMINHRNGKWFNVNSNSAHEDKDITVFASRDIHKGEQLYLSYNECFDCVGYAWTYVLPNIFKDYGFVEQYPRRWNIEDLAFEIDQDEETKELKLTFLNGEPNDYQLKFMRAQLKRLRGLKDHVLETAAELESEHERFMSVEYYEAMMTALELFLEEAEADTEQECSITDSGEKTCAFREYDALDKLPKRLSFNYDICDFGRIHQSSKYKKVLATESHYQRMVFKYSSKLDDTCLFMDNHLHACASFRPHYHEVFVHYPAMYVDEVKRVAFIGGGDNMIVHEILKYPSLELAVGLELDQGVVRSSFQQFGTQPRFDDPRLQWFFGDGSKSILMLPEEYYGSFDIVYVDLQNDVVDILQVADELSITEAAMLLMKPDGVIARNEDWEFGTNEPFTDYAVDILYVDVPVIGYQGMTLGSNTVDFFTQAPKDHGVETIYMKDAMENNNGPFGIWVNYRKSTNRTSAICRQPDEQDKALLTDEYKSMLGVLLIIEAEDAVVPLKEPTQVQDSVSQVLNGAELTEINVEVIYDEPEDDQASEDEGYEIAFILQEGYVYVRVWPEYKYCAFDVMLWSKTHTLEAIETQLSTAVGSESVSSYRILTSGMYGSDDKGRIGPSITEVCKEEPEGADVKGATVAPSSMDSIVTESLALLQDTSALIVFLCGDQSKPCSTVNALEESNAVAKVVPLWACPNLTDQAQPQDMLACEMETLRTLRALDTKINGFVIDREAPRYMGQILLKILSNGKVQRELLEEKHLVVATSESDSSETTSWRRVLVDRFRSHIVKYDPAHHAEIAFENVELDVFSSGDDDFFNHLVDVMNSLKAKIGHAPVLRSVKNGINNYIADFEPSITFSHADYDDTLPLQQYKSQNQLEVQTVYLLVADKALDRAFVKQWLEQAVEKLNGDDDDEAIVKVYDNVGSGSVLHGVWDLGSVVAVWDGRQAVSVNLLSSQNRDRLERFFANDWKIVSKDEMPRGTGKVVSFRQGGKKEKRTPRWAKG